MRNLIDTSSLQDKAGASSTANISVDGNMPSPHMIIKVTCHGPDEADRSRYVDLKRKALVATKCGLSVLASWFESTAQSLVKEQWVEENANLVTTEGKTLIVDTLLKGSSYTAAWYMLLCGSGTISAGDTLGTHSGWTEVTAYSGSRPAITWGTTTAGSNTASANVITMTGTYTVAGAGSCTVASGSSGTLYNASDFAVARSGGTGDTLTITMTISVT